jgi:hypothetical protein
MIALLILAAIADPVWIGQFTGKGQPPPPWRVVHLNRKVPPTTYRRTTLSGVHAIEARSQGSMALLARPIAVDLSATPVLCWRWLVDAPVARADMTRKSGDDYAARLYVAFDVPDAQMSAGTRVKLRLARSLFGREVPDAALNYVWDNRHPVGTRRKSPYTDRAQLVVAETGVGRAGQWVTERTDIVIDFDKAFGGTAKPIQLAVASDTDNTGGTAHAAFADIHFVARSQRCRF